MASNTRKVKIRRKLRSASAGKWRKAQARNHGTTQPDLPLDRPNANEKARQAKAKA